MTVSLPPPIYATYVIERHETSAISGPDPERPKVLPPTVEQSLTEKLASARQQIFDLQYMLDGWDGYDALAPTASTVDRALRWLVSSYTECRDEGVNWTVPRVTATAEGEVALKWYASDWSLSVYVLSEPEGGGYVESHKHRPAGENGSGASDIGEDANSPAAQIALMRWLEGMLQTS